MIGVGRLNAPSPSGRGVYTSGKRSINCPWMRTNIKELELSDPVAWPQVRIVLHVASANPDDMGTLL